MSKSRKIRMPETEGEMQLGVETARDQLSRAIGKWRSSGVIEDMDPYKYKQNTIEFNLLLAYQEITRVWEGMIKQWGRTDGQLCPNQKCLWKLAFPQGAGWYTCPHCFSEFYCQETDGGIEDYHCYLPGPRVIPLPPKTPSIPFARDLGPSTWSLRPGMK